VSILLLITLHHAAGIEPVDVEPIALDAGTLRSAVMEGFARLHREGCEDSRVRWEAQPRVARVDRWPDPLAGDHLVGGELHVDLPPGRWLVWAMLGWESPYRHLVATGQTFGLRADGSAVLAVDHPTTLPAFLASPFYAANPFPHFRSGETSWDRQVSRLHRWWTGQLEVDGEGGVLLEPFGRPLQALVLFPEGRRAEAEVFVESTDLLRKSWFHDHHDPDEGWALPLSEGPLQVRPGLPGGEGSGGEGLHLELAREARTTRYFTVGPGDETTAFRIEGLEGLEVSTWEVHWLDHKPLRKAQVRVAPTFLRPTTEVLRGGQGVPLGLALTIRVPEDHPAEVVEGSVVVERGAEEARVPVEVRVRDLDLVPAPIPTGFFHRVPWISRHLEPFGSEEVFDLLQQDFAAMRERDLDLVSVRLWRIWHAERTAPSFDREVLEAWARVGGTHLGWEDGLAYLNRTAYARPTGPVMPEGYQDVVRESSRFAEDAPLEVFYYLYDEEGYKHLDYPARARELCAALEPLLPPGVRTMAVTPQPSDWLVVDAFDIATFHVTMPGVLANLEAAREAGTEAWVYNVPHGRSAPVVAWAVGAEGHVQWHWNDAALDPFDYVHSYSNQQYAILAPGGDLWPTLDLEGFAEGRVDQRVLATLEAEVSALEATRSRRKRRRAEPGRELLEAVRQAVQTPLSQPDYAWDTLPPQALEHLRQAAADEAESLQEARRARGRTSP